MLRKACPIKIVLNVLGTEIPDHELDRYVKGIFKLKYTIHDLLLLDNKVILLCHISIGTGQLAAKMGCKNVCYLNASRANDIFNSLLLFSK